MRFEEIVKRLTDYYEMLQEYGEPCSEDEEEECLELLTSDSDEDEVR